MSPWGWACPTLHSQTPSSTLGGSWNSWPTRDKGKNLPSGPGNQQSSLVLVSGQEGVLGLRPLAPLASWAQSPCSLSKRLPSRANPASYHSPTLPRFIPCHLGPDFIPQNLRPTCLKGTRHLTRSPLDFPVAYGLCRRNHGNHTCPLTLLQPLAPSPLLPCSTPKCF